MSRAQLSRLIDLPDDDLQQVLDYAATLSKADAVDHFKNLLGDEPQAIEFISAFNARRHDPAAASVAAAAAATAATAPGEASSASDAAPKRPAHKKKKKPPLHTPPARSIANLGPPPGAVYHKKSQEDDYYLSGRSGASTPLGPNRATTPVSASTTPPPPAKAAAPPPPKPPPQPAQPRAKTSSAAGSLIQDALLPKPKPKPSPAGGSGSNKSGPVAKIAITGGTAMHGASTALADFDDAIRALEINSSSKPAPRRCNCVATRHPLQTAAPNCLHCGKVVCVKEGLGPCTACGRPLLAANEVQATAHQRPDVAGGAHHHPHARTAPRPTMIAGTTTWGTDESDYVSPAEAQARAHRDRLLAFQAQNAQRTTVRDEAADFDVGAALQAQAEGGDDNPGSASGGSIWATPTERAHALQQQQKLLREMAWNSRPEYEKRQQVLSIDLTGRKVFRKTVVAAERPRTPDSEKDEDEEDADDGAFGGSGASVLAEADANRGSGGGGGGGGGAFSKNPLLGRLIKPVYDPKARRSKIGTDRPEVKKGQGQGKGKGKGKGSPEEAESETVEQPLPGRSDNPNAATRWRRVQDDLDDNEAVILDGGLYGSAVVGDEPEG
ncbi:c2hc5 finger protein [Niveomyces insectorum RCEF 264]|uniref:C2hc5 finger protein n=1 Tax=Niveomyces insectorum RCEF 264 TaxID=1081102 RepID=A0A167Z584_9HYPO|nr:c2hc5 finger protein [Niveomyces insectorum RCEF 264]